jgi:(1->4)-alpha-D-glucan 1-alpha-D-glucosylmutase
MLASSTHDTKRSEDVRARLAVLSEIPQLWSQQVMRWKRTNAASKTELEDGRVAPDPNEEYLLYQTLVGTWEFDTVQPTASYQERIIAYIHKAMHEAKTNLSWINPDEEYAGAVQRFIQQIVEPRRNGSPNFFVRDLANFVQAVQFHGAINSVGQALIKVTAPGVPDVYQGTELLDLSLVDPDNRRPVDFGHRRRILDELDSIRAEDRAQAALRTAERVHTGEAKLWALQRALCFRRERSDIYFRGDYLPVHAAGTRREHIVAFARQQGDALALTVAPRFTHTLMKGRMTLPLGEVWGDTELLLPPGTPNAFENLLTGEIIHATAQSTLPCREVLRVFPCALLAPCR